MLAPNGRGRTALKRYFPHYRLNWSEVKNMLRHSRESSGEHRPVDINALVDESLSITVPELKRQASILLSSEILIRMSA
jgi:hypothetical protein